MNDNHNASPQTLREAFYTLSTAKDVPDAEQLDNVVRCYPQFGEELTEFAIAIALDALRGDWAVDAGEAALDPMIVSPGVSRAMSRFHNRIYAVAASASEQSATTQRTQAPLGSSTGGHLCG